MIRSGFVTLAWGVLIGLGVAACGGKKPATTTPAGTTPAGTTSEPAGGAAYGGATYGAGEPTGEFDTTFTFSAKYAPTGEEIHGRCQHPIVSGSGDFSGASGVLSFKDIPSEGRFPYHGNVQL